VTAKQKASRVCVECKIEKGHLAYSGPRARICKKCRGIKGRTTQRYAHVVKTYRLSPAEYELLIQATKDEKGARRCQLCREVRATHFYPIDHDHAVEREHGMRKSIRGLICKSCNRLLRDARDSSSLLRKAADYLDDWPARRTLLWVHGTTHDRLS
jgi:hypothetical protein